MELSFLFHFIFELLVIRILKLFEYCETPIVPTTVLASTKLDKSNPGWYYTRDLVTTRTYLYEKLSVISKVAVTHKGKCEGSYATAAEAAARYAELIASEGGEESQPATGSSAGKKAARKPPRVRLPPPQPPLWAGRGGCSL